jgi:16S rRNA (guanine966-N2)-methyltransferase
MRVISGSAGGISLKTPTHDVRPTMDMVREAIFSSLGDLVIGARVLDLFAGSGSFGIEALSRGAAEAVFIDNHPKSVEAIRFNLAKTRLVGTVIREDVFKYLQRVNQPFRLIFADPPYAKHAGDRNYALEILEFKALSTAIDPEGILILERTCARKDAVSGIWKITRSRKYGKTEVIFCVLARKNHPKSRSDELID